MNTDVKTTQKEREYASIIHENPVLFMHHIVFDLFDLDVNLVNRKVIGGWRSKIKIKVNKSKTILFRTDDPPQIKEVFKNTNKDKIIKSKKEL